MGKNTSMEERIALLLRKAESTDSEHERDALSAAAEKLMIKYGIEMAELDMDPKHRDNDPIETKVIVIRGIYAMQMEGIAEFVATAMGARAFFRDMRKWNNTVVLTVVDFRSTLPHIVRLCESIMIQAERAMRVWWKANRRGYDRNDGYIARRSYLEGFRGGAASRIIQERQDALKTTSKHGELVLARQDRLDDHMGSEFNITPRKPSRKELLDRYALLDGHEDGTNVDTAVAAGSVTT